MEASFGYYRDEIGHDDNCEGGRRDQCDLSVDLAVLEPRGHNEQNGACRNLTTECDETPGIKMYAEHRRAEAPIAWQDMQQIWRLAARAPSNAAMIAMPWPTAIKRVVRIVVYARSKICKRPSPTSAKAIRCITQSGQGGSPNQNWTAKAAVRIPLGSRRSG